MTDLYFEVCDGEALDIVKRYVADYKERHAQARELANEFGAERYWHHNGRVTALDLDGKQHPDFTKPDNAGRSWPKKKTAARARFDQQQPSVFPHGDVSKEFGIPTSIHYKSPDGKAAGYHSTARHRYTTTGVLFISEAGPYAIYCPDVREEVAELEAEGYIVDTSAKDWRPLIPGCRLILEAQWKLYVAQHELKEARAAREAAAMTSDYSEKGK